MGMLLLVFYSYAIYGADKINLISDAAKSKSVSYSFLSTLPHKTETTMTKFKPLFQDFYNKMKETFKQSKEYDKTQKQT
jgi:hypothetical protein